MLDHASDTEVAKLDSAILCDKDISTYNEVSIDETTSMRDGELTLQITVDNARHMHPFNGFRNFSQDDLNEPLLESLWSRTHLV